MDKKALSIAAANVALFLVSGFLLFSAVVAGSGMGLIVAAITKNKVWAFSTAVSIFLAGCAGRDHAIQRLAIWLAPKD